MEVEEIELLRAVERMHTCKARLAQSVPVIEPFEGKTVWEGVVHVFDLSRPGLSSRSRTCFGLSSSLSSFDQTDVFFLSCAMGQSRRRPANPPNS